MGPTYRFEAVDFWKSMEAGRHSTPKEVLQDQRVILAKEAFDRFCKNPNQSDSTIPKLIHLIWLGSPPTALVNMSMLSWREHHPDWEIMLWTDKEIKELKNSHPRSDLFFREAKSWAEKSDITRLEILYQYGGIYADTDTVCLKSLEPLIQRGTSFFSGFQCNVTRNNGRPIIATGLMGSRKNHPLLHRCIEYSYTSTERPHCRLSIRSGPGSLTRACYEALESNEQDMLVLPCSYFYPIPFGRHQYCHSLKEVLDLVRPESFSIHLWEGSWI